MKTLHRSLFSALVATALAFIGSAGFSFAADLSAGDKLFLAGYEKVRTALVADDLASAKKAASELGNPGTALAASPSLKEARTAFAKLSDDAKKLAAGQPGFYTVHCSMLKQDWVQTSTDIGNPYAGKEMAECGEIVK